MLKREALESAVISAAKCRGMILTGEIVLWCVIALPLAWLRKNATGKGWMPNRINGESRKGQGDEPNQSKHWTMFWCFFICASQRV